MTRSARIGIAAASALPTLIVTLVVLTGLAYSGLIPWSVEPAVVLALLLQVFITYYRLGRRGDVAGVAADPGS